MKWKGGDGTICFNLLDELIVLPPQLRPFRELVLRARGVELGADFEELLFQLALLGGGFGGRCWEAVVDIPELFPNT